MRFSRSIAPLLGLAALAALGPVAAPVHAQSYTLTLLGTLSGDTNSFGSAVNNAGQVTGSSYIGSGSSTAFLSGANGGPVKGLGTLPGDIESLGSAVNNSGQVTGYSGDKDFLYSHAFLSGANGGALKDLGTLPGDGSSEGFAVNASGQVAGESDGPIGSHAFLSGANGGPLKDLGSLGGDTSDFAVSRAFGVNDAGQVTGGSMNGDGDYHAFLSGTNGGSLKDLGTFGGGSSEGHAVNSAGQVTGQADTSDGHYHAFRSVANGGLLQDLGTLPGDAFSVGNGINDAGQVVGNSLSSDFNTSVAFVFSNGVMTDLNSLIAPGSGFSLIFATGISNTGFISGYGSDTNGIYHGFLLTPVNAPVPEASTTVSLGLLLALGMGGMVVAARRKKPAA